MVEGWDSAPHWSASSPASLHLTSKLLHLEHFLPGTHPPSPWDFTQMTACLLLSPGPSLLRHVTFQITVGLLSSHCSVLNFTLIRWVCHHSTHRKASLKKAEDIANLCIVCKQAHWLACNSIKTCLSGRMFNNIKISRKDV